jgi:hypothetical protein
MITGLSQHGVDERAPPTQDAKRARVALKATDHGTLEKARRLPHLHTHRKPLPNPPLRLHPTRRTALPTQAGSHHKNLPRPHTKQLEPPKSRHSPHKARRSQNPHRSRQIHYHKHRQTYPQIHKPAPPFDKGAAAIIKKLEEIELKKPSS